MCQNYAKYQLTTITKALMLDEKVYDLNNSEVVFKTFDFILLIKIC